MIDVCRLTGKNAVTYEQGAKLLSAINRELGESERVTLDFSRVSIVVSSYLNASIAPLLKTRDVSELQSRLEFKGLREHDRHTLNVVIHNAIQFYQDNDAIDE